MDLKIITIKKHEDSNVIIGQSHFIKTVEDMYECLITQVPNIKFGFAFCEASGPCLVRSEGNDIELKKLAEENANTIKAGHSFVLIIKNAFPINILNAIKQIPEICNIYCATANPLQIIVTETDQGRGIIGVIDGSSPKGIETDKDIIHRKEFLRKIGYKL